MKLYLSLCALHSSGPPHSDQTCCFIINIFWEVFWFFFLTDHKQKQKSGLHKHTPITSKYFYTIYIMVYLERYKTQRYKIPVVFYLHLHLSSSQSIYFILYLYRSIYMSIFQDIFNLNKSMNRESCSRKKLPKQNF